MKDKVAFLALAARTFAEHGTEVGVGELRGLSKILDDLWADMQEQAEGQE